MRISKAVITTAGAAQRTLPLQTLVDRDGKAKSALQILLDEATAAGVEEICLVIAPGDQKAYTEAAGPHARALRFVEQPQPRGYAHALSLAKPFAGGDSVLHLVGDHLYLSRSDRRCAQQLVETAVAHGCAVSAVQPTRESLLPHYGVVGGRRVQGEQGVYEIDQVVEKPTPTVAEQRLIVPGLRAGHYLCFFGMHVLTPAVFELIAQQLSAAGEKPLSLSSALDLLPRRERYLAVELAGTRHNIGVQYGLLMTQLALALDGNDRDEVLSQLVELLASRSR